MPKHFVHEVCNRYEWTAKKDRRKIGRDCLICIRTTSTTFFDRLTSSHRCANHARVNVPNIPLSAWKKLCSEQQPQQPSGCCCRRCFNGGCPSIPLTWSFQSRREILLNTNIYYHTIKSVIFPPRYERKPRISCLIECSLVECESNTPPMYRDSLYLRCRDCILASSLRDRVAYSDVMCLILAGSKTSRSRAAKAKKISIHFQTAS